MIVDMFLPATHWEDVEYRLSIIPKQRHNEPHAKFATEWWLWLELVMPWSWSNMEFTKLVDCYGPNGSAKSKFQWFRRPGGWRLWTGIPAWREDLEIIPNEGSKPVQKTLVTNNKFIQLLTHGMFNTQLVSYVNAHTEGMPLPLPMEKLRNADDKDFARKTMAKGQQQHNCQRRRRYIYDCPRPCCLYFKFI